VVVGVGIAIGVGVAVGEKVGVTVGVGVAVGLGVGVGENGGDGTGVLVEAALVQPTPTIAIRSNVGIRYRIMGLVPGFQISTV